MTNFAELVDKIGLGKFFELRQYVICASRHISPALVFIHSPEELVGSGVRVDSVAAKTARSETHPRVNYKHAVAL